LHKTKETYSFKANANEAFEISHDNFLVGKQDDLEHTEMILRALNKLPPRQKEIIYLKIYRV
jgi:DNA-directed RNA polymerase specialized sigma24 family protein